MSHKTEHVTVRSPVQVVLVLMGFVLLIAASAAHPLPILFSPPPHYQVLRKLGQRGELGGYGGEEEGGLHIGIQNSTRGRSVLKHWLRVAGKLGANALLLHPLCPSSWLCRPDSGWWSFERYSAEAIRIQGSLCTMPLQCWSAQAILTGTKALRHGRHVNAFEDDIHISSFPRAFGLSITVGLPAPMSPKERSGTIQSVVQGHLRCTMRREYSFFNPAFMGMPTFASARVDAQGQVETKQLIIFRIKGDMETDRMIARFLRHWRFKGTGIGSHPVHLLMDWHLVQLHKGQPIPPGVVCAYPAYPATGSWRGKVIRHLRWSVYTLSEGRKKETFAANPIRVR